MLDSPAWQARSVPLSRILERLEIEHMRHAGMNNGGLQVSSGQFVDCGVSRKDIRRSLQLGADLGLLEVKRPIKKTMGPLRTPNEYRLTYLPEGQRLPSDEWKRVDRKQSGAAQRRYQNAAAKKRGLPVRNHGQ